MGYGHEKSNAQSTVWLSLSAILICASMSPAAMEQGSGDHESPEHTAASKKVPFMPDRSTSLTRLKLKFEGYEAVVELMTTLPHAILCPCYRSR